MIGAEKQDYTSSKKYWSNAVDEKAFMEQIQPIKYGKRWISIVNCVKYFCITTDNNQLGTNAKVQLAKGCHQS